MNEKEEEQVLEMMRETLEGMEFDALVSLITDREVQRGLLLDFARHTLEAVEELNNRRDDQECIVEIQGYIDLLKRIIESLTVLNGADFD